MMRCALFTFVPFVKIVKDPSDDPLMIGSVIRHLNVPGVVGRDADQSQQLLSLFRREHVVQQGPLLQQVVRNLQTAIVNPFLCADLKNKEELSYKFVH